MRKSLLLVAVVPLMLTPPAMAATARQGGQEKSESVCGPPEITHA
jgi:hypothetical protein